MSWHRKAASEAHLLVCLAHCSISVRLNLVRYRRWYKYRITFLIYYAMTHVLLVVDDRFRLIILAYRSVSELVTVDTLTVLNFEVLQNSCSS